MYASREYARTFPARWALGQPLDGRKRTTASWISRGEILENMHSSKRGCRSFVRVAFARWSYLAFVFLWLYGYCMHRTFTVTVTFVTLGTAALMLSVLVSRAVMRSQHRKRYAEPLANVLGPAIGHNEATSKAWDMWLTSPRQYRKVGMIAKCDPNFHPTDKDSERVQAIVNEKLPGQWGIDWQTQGQQTALVIAPLVPPPPEVPFAMLERKILDAPKFKPVIGIGFDNQIFDVDIRESIGASMARGIGKSTFLRPIISHCLRYNMRVILLDDKGMSQQWANDLDGFECYSSPEEWAKILPELHAEMKRRYKIMETAPNTQFQPIVVIWEERNTFTAISRIAWSTMEWKGKGKKPYIAPWITLGDILVWEAREAGIYVETVGQRLSCTAIGPDTRENYILRFGARYTRQTAAMLFGDTVMPQLAHIPGRMAFARIGDAKATELQIVNMSPEQARAVALNKVVSLERLPASESFHKLSSNDWSQTTLSDDADSDLLDLTASFDGHLTMEELSSELGIKYNTLAKRLMSVDAPDHVKEGRYKKYDLAEVRDYLGKENAEH